MTLNLDVENQKRWTDHLSKHKEAFNKTGELQIDMVRELRRNEYIKDGQVIQLKDRLYGSTLLEVLRNPTPTAEKAEDMVSIFEKYDCGLVANVMKRFNKNGKYFANMMTNQSKISKLVNNVDKVVNGLVENELLTIGEKGRITKFSNEAIQKKTLVEILALKDVDDEMSNIVTLLEYVGETEFVDAINKCLNPQIPEDRKLDSRNGAAAHPVQAVVPQAQVPVVAQAQPNQAASATVGNTEQPLKIDYKAWCDFLANNDEILRQTLNLDNSIVATLKSAKFLEDPEDQNITKFSEAEKDARAVAFLDLIKDKWSEIKILIEVFKNGRQKRKTPGSLMSDFLKEQGYL